MECGGGQGDQVGQLPIGVVHVDTDIQSQAGGRRGAERVGWLAGRLTDRPG